MTEKDFGWIEGFWGVNGHIDGKPGFIEDAQDKWWPHGGSDEIKGVGEV